MYKELLRLITVLIVNIGYQVDRKKEKTIL